YRRPPTAAANGIRSGGQPHRRCPGHKCGGGTASVREPVNLPWLLLIVLSLRAKAGATIARSPPPPTQVANNSQAGLHHRNSHVPSLGEKFQIWPGSDRLLGSYQRTRRSVRDP